jgi:predicted RNase H-like HicB family nuclease
VLAGENQPGTGRADEAIANIREAIQCHLEGLRLDGLPAPEPRAQIATVDVEAA